MVFSCRDIALVLRNKPRGLVTLQTRSTWYVLARTLGRNSWQRSMSVEAQAQSGEAAADCPYINDYCRQRHNSVVVCSWTPEKGRILRSQKAFLQGEVIFREPPLHIVAEQKGNTAFDRLKQLCAQQAATFEYEPLWYWTALSSLKASQLGPGETRLKAISQDQQRKLLLLYHSEVEEASEAAKLLVKDLSLKCLDPLDLERLLQVWILNCFEHSDDPLGYSTYFMSSFMSHSCMPNAVWHYDGDDFVLRARSDIAADDEICVSYLSEDALLEAIPARRKHLKDSKHFVCTCVRCTSSQDRSRGFRCPSCGEQALFPSKAQAQDPPAVADDLVDSTCECCKEGLTKAQATLLLSEEKWLEQKLDTIEKRMEKSSRSKHTSLLKPLEEAATRGGKALAQHWLLDKTWQILADVYDRNERPEDAEAMVQNRLGFQEAAYLGLSGTHAWTLEALGDMMLRHAGVVLEPRVKVPNENTARRVEGSVPQVYEASLRILRLMFGDKHEYFQSVNRKAQELAKELARLSDKGGSSS